MESVLEMGKVAEAYLQVFFSIHHRSGDTLASIEVTPLSSTTVRISVGGVAEFFEGGTVPHPISTMKRAFFNPDTGFFLRNPFYPGGILTVDHPGQPEEEPVAESRRQAEAVGQAILRKNLP